MVFLWICNSNLQQKKKLYSEEKKVTFTKSKLGMGHVESTALAKSTNISIRRKSFQNVVKPSVNK